MLCSSHFFIPFFMSVEYRWVYSRKSFTKSIEIFSVIPLVISIFRQIRGEKRRTTVRTMRCRRYRWNLNLRWSSATRQGNPFRFIPSKIMAKGIAKGTNFYSNRIDWFWYVSSNVTTAPREYFIHLSEVEIRSKLFPISTKYLSTRILISSERGTFGQYPSNEQSRYAFSFFFLFSLLFLPSPCYEEQRNVHYFLGLPNAKVVCALFKSILASNLLYWSAERE